MSYILPVTALNTILKISFTLRGRDAQGRGWVNVETSSRSEMSKPPKKDSVPALGGRVQNKETPAQEGIDKFVESVQVTVSETSDFVSGFALGALGQLVMPFVTEPVPYIPAEGVKSDKSKVASLPRLLRLLPRPRDILRSFASSQQCVALVARCQSFRWRVTGSPRCRLAVSGPQEEKASCDQRGGRSTEQAAVSRSELARFRLVLLYACSV
jgi:hypothetical protein